MKYPTAIWNGNWVHVLATDPEDPGCQIGKGACWVRFWPDEKLHPQYISCDLSDLENYDQKGEVVAITVAGLNAVVSRDLFYSALYLSRPWWQRWMWWLKPVPFVPVNFTGFEVIYPEDDE